MINRFDLNIPCATSTGSYVRYEDHIAAIRKAWKYIVKNNESHFPDLACKECNPCGTGDVVAANYLCGYHEAKEGIRMARIK